MALPYPGRRCSSFHGLYLVSAMVDCRRCCDQGYKRHYSHPWGAEVVRQVRVQADPALYSMPAFFTPFTWAYFGASMLALAASLFVNWKIPLGPIKVPVATVLILLVGLSYLTTVGLAYGIGTLRAAGMDVSFTGKSEFMDPMSHRKMKMEAYLQPGYWRALYSGIVFVVLAGLRILFYRRAKGQ